MTELAELTIRQFAGEGEEFGPDAFDTNVGHVMKFKTALGILRGGILLASAEVADDGSYVDLVFEIPSNVAALLSTGLLSY
jgi:hypothetical protein